MTNLTLVVDGNNLAIRAYSSHKTLSHEGLSTGMLYGVMSSLRRLVQAYEPSHVMWFWDHGRSSYRSGIFPEYKSNRSKELSEDRAESFQMTDEFLRLVGVPPISLLDTEADDLIANVALSKREGSRMVIVSGDHDLHQLVTDSVMIHNPNGKGGELLTLRKIQKKYEVDDPKVLADIWAVQGDPGDGIVGLKGFGPKKSHALLKSTNWDLELAIAGMSARSKETVRRNKKLIELDGTVAYVSLPEESFIFSKSDYDPPKLGSFLGKYGMKSVLHDTINGEFWG